jgi:hypothetical protein
VISLVPAVSCCIWSGGMEHGKVNLYGVSSVCQCICTCLCVTHEEGTKHALTKTHVSMRICAKVALHLDHCLLIPRNQSSGIVKHMLGNVLVSSSKFDHERSTPRIFLCPFILFIFYLSKSTIALPFLYTPITPTIIDHQRCPVPTSPCPIAPV